MAQSMIFSKGYQPPPSGTQYYYTGQTPQSGTGYFVNNNQSFNNAPYQSPQVLGAATSTIGGGGNSKPASAPTNNNNNNNNNGNNNSNVGQMPSQQDIDNAFSGVYNGLDAQTNALTGNRDLGLNTAQQQADNASGLIPGQEQKLRDVLASSQNAQQQETQSAYADALRSYNALQQRSLGLFGGQSSAAGAVNDLMNQEYLRTRGQIGNQDQTAQLQFGAENHDIQSWVATQSAQVKNWLLDAQQQIQSQFTSHMADISSQRGQTDTAKSMAKLNLVSELVQHQQALQTMNQQFQQYIQLAGAGGGPAIQNFDQSGFQNQMANIGNTIAALPQQFSASNAITPNFGQNNNNQVTYNPYLNQKPNDQLQKLLGGNIA